MQIYIYNNGTQHNLIEDILDNGIALFTDGELPIADSSYRYSEIMGDDNCVINFALPVFFEFPIGCCVNVDNTEYTLLELGNVTKQNERWYDYTLTFESPAKQLSRYKFRNHVDGRLNFTLTAQPQEFIAHIITNLNQREGANNWMLGDCIVSSEKTQSFSHNTILDALNAVAQLFETEWEINGKTISLKKVEYNRTNPLTLSYGMGNGFKSGISRQLSGEKAVDQLWVEGGDRNIDSSVYVINQQHVKKLRLPSNQAFVYIPSDGEPDSNGIIDRGHLIKGADWLAMSQAQRNLYPDALPVMTDIDGFGITRAKVELDEESEQLVFVTNFINNGYEESLEATDIYPHKVLLVDTATCMDEEKRFWDITVKTSDGSPIPDYNSCLIGGETVTMIFNTGMLTGKEFNIANQGTDSNPIVIKDGVIKIQPAEIDGIIMPDKPYTSGGTGYQPRPDEEFGIFHVMLPQQYVDEAEEDLLLTACEYLYKHGEVEVEFNGTVDGIWAKENWDDINPYIKLGGYIKFYDPHILGGADGKLMRILNIKQYINNPHSPEITLSNSSVSQGVSSEIKKIPQNQVYALAEIDKQVAYTKRSFEDTKDTQKMLEEAFVNQGDYFSESITPVSVETMQMIVGSEDLQFMFGDVAAYDVVSGRKRVRLFNEFNYNPTYADNQLVCSTVYLRHYSYTSHKGEITAATDAVFPYWDMPPRTFQISNPNQSYYLYAICAKVATEPNNLGFITEGNRFILETAPHAHTNDSYYFLVGVLNREKDGTRSFASLYGYTEVLGNRVTTGRIVSADGQTWFDLTTGEIRTNKSIKFSWQGNEQDLAAALTKVSNSAEEGALLSAADSYMSSGYMLYRDPEFTRGFNGIGTYNNMSGGAVSLYRITDNTAANQYHNVIKIRTYGQASPACGGFYFANQSRANAIFVYKIRAKIPSGYWIDCADNSYGNNPYRKWVTPTYGDGTWRDYIHVKRCGESGSFSTIGHFFLDCGSSYSKVNVTWYVCYATCFDCTSFEAIKTALQNSTDIIGGVVLSNVIQVRNNSSVVTAGMSGLNPNSTGKNPRFWAGGDFSAATTAAAEAEQDVPAHSLPILLLDGGYNSNIGLFKVLPDAIAVMRSGQVVRISANDFATEQANYSPSTPTNKILTSGKRVNYDTSTSNWTWGSWTVGTFSKTGTYDITIHSATIKGFIDHHRIMYSNGNSTCYMWVGVYITCGNRSATLRDAELARTTSGTTYNTTADFYGNGSISIWDTTLYGVDATAGQAITLSVGFGITVTGNTGAIITDHSYYLQATDIKITLSERKSCFVIAKGGFSCAQSANKSLIFNAADGVLDFNGSNFRINGMDFIKHRSKTVSFSSGGYIDLIRVGQLVTMKINIRKDSMGSGIIPSGYRPAINLSTVCTTAGNSSGYLVDITTSGAITSSYVPSNTVAYGTVSYVCVEDYP